MTMSVLNRDDCESIVRRLWPFLDGKLTDADREIVVDHLASCTECRSHFDFAKAFLEAVHGLQPSGRADDGLRTRVIAALAKEGYSDG